MKLTFVNSFRHSIFPLVVLFCSGLFAQTPNYPGVQLADSSQMIADRIVKSEIPVLIDFWAAWCGPCKLLNPIISELEKEYKGKISFLKVNVDVHKAISAYFQVQAIPAVFLVHNKTVVKYFPGLQSKEVYSGAIREILAIAKNKEAVVDSLKK